MDIRVEIDGQAAPSSAADEVPPDSHFTAMQVRGGAVRGLARHLDRLDRASREIYGVGLDGDRVRAAIRHALVDSQDASVRTVVFAGAEGALRVMVTVRPPNEMPAGTQLLKSLRFRRPRAHLKQRSTFGHSAAMDAAVRDGFTDVLLVGDDGEISEGGIVNAAFYDGESVIWPAAPHLAGITMQVLEPLLPSVRRGVRFAEVPSFAGSFVTNSRGIAAVSRIDDIEIPVDYELLKRVQSAYESVPWDRI